MQHSQMINYHLWSSKKGLEKLSNSKIWNPKNASLTLSEVRRETKCCCTHGCGGRGFYTAWGFIVGKNVFAGVEATSWRGLWSDYISYARYISSVPAGRPGRRFWPSWNVPPSLQHSTKTTTTTTTTATTLRTPFLNPFLAATRGFFKAKKRFSYYFGEFFWRSVHDITYLSSALLYLSFLKTEHSLKNFTWERGHFTWWHRSRERYFWDCLFSFLSSLSEIVSKSEEEEKNF